MHPDMRVLTPNHKGWKRMWKELAAHLPKEGWEYFVSSDREHQFRNRAIAGKIHFTQHKPCGCSQSENGFFYVKIQPGDWDIATDLGVNEVVAGPVNDYTCKRCGNHKCSKTEKSCWKCGEPIQRVA